MARVGEGTVFQVKAPAVIAICAAVGVCAWVVWTFAIGGLREDVQALSQELHGGLSASDRRADSVETATREDIATLTARIEAIQTSIDRVDAALTKSVERQTAFERWVIIELGRVSAVAGSGSLSPLPMGWGDPTDTIERLSEGTNPLTEWEALSGPAFDPFGQKP